MTHKLDIYNNDINDHDDKIVIRKHFYEHDN